MTIIINWLLSAIAIMISAYLLPGVSVASFISALIVAVVLGILNAIVKPILLFLTLPLNILTLGLFTFVINAIVILLASSFIPGFRVNGFWWALAFSIVLSLVNMIFASFEK